MTTFIYEPIMVGHCPAFALWISRLTRANGESTVLYLADSILESTIMKPNIDLAREAGVEIRSAGLEGEHYTPDAGRIASDWYTNQRETSPGDRLIVPTVDLIIKAGYVPTPSSDVRLDIIMHQPGSEVRLVPPWTMLRRGRTGLRQIKGIRQREHILKSIPANQTFVIDPHELLGPGKRRFMRRFGSLDPRLLPIGTLNTEGYEPTPSARHALGLPTEGPMLVIIGSIGNGDSKGRSVLQKAWSEVRRRVPNASLAVLGASIDTKKIDNDATATEQGNGVFRLSRVLSHPELLGIASEGSAVWAVRDRVEGMSSIADIALHFGRPVIVAAINVSAAWFTPGAGGELVDPGSHRSVARAILRAFDRSKTQSTPPPDSFGGFEGAVEALSGRRRFTSEDLPARLRNGSASR
ncbi:MAG: hypothetical protein CBC35_04115 [Planctomycetes bacterium TMED75]|nr:hypothetical protein [Planctomycetaceae bacterium]OUU94344.1 MAG: hypothetical protein CBC35_04115 [Planctomycetes bacterium TMED75]